MASTIQSNEQVQVQSSDDHSIIPKEVFLACATAQAHMQEIEQQTLVMIEDTIVGDATRVESITAQLDPKKKVEFELMARVIISKALDEPQHCKACVSLSGALHVLLPTLPSGQQGKKGETFMHALLDVFQTEFEEIIMGSPENNVPEDSGTTFDQRNQSRIRAIVHFAGHLYCFRLLGNGVVSSMVQDLVDNAQPEAANELLWFIGVVTTTNTNTTTKPPNLGTVLEDDASDGTGSESIRTPERRSLVS